MEKLFGAAATPSQPTGPQPSIITSDWQGTLLEAGMANYTLLEDLSDALRAGHRVIITSTVAAHKYEQNFELLVMSARRRGYDVLDAKDFETALKSDLQKMDNNTGLEVDWAFDNEPIATQFLANYVRPALEVRILDGGFRSFPRTNFRALLGLAPKPEYGVQLDETLKRQP